MSASRLISDMLFRHHCKNLNRDVSEITILIKKTYFNVNEISGKCELVFQPFLSSGINADHHLIML